MLGEKKVMKKRKTPESASSNITDLQQEVLRLTEQAESLKREVYQLQIERDVLQKASELIKKDKGISLQNLTNREKAIVINALRSEYPLKELLKIMNMAKSSYCYQNKALSKDKYKDIRNQVRSVFEESFGTYGYRRIYSVFRTEGIILSEKVIRRIMKEDKLHVKHIKQRKYNSYKGEISPEVKNIINRNFHADKPNSKWLTDITEFHIPAGKIYLSPIIDCFDGLPVSWTIGTAPDADLVNTMLDEAIALLNDYEKPIIHTDRGCHYRWPGWISRMDNAGLIRSMSKKGCSPDNSACEGFFGRLKNEMFYGRSWIGVSIEEFIQILDSYIRWYAESRIKISLGGMSPLDYRRSLGIAV
jgi:transposase InsO family protein/FtsZ-binding cell division protein ZapB